MMLDPLRDKLELSVVDSFPPFERIEDMMNYRLGAASLIAVIAVFTSVSAGAQTVDQLIDDMNNGRCPVRYVIYNDVSYRQHCGQDYINEMYTSQALACQSETDKLNRAISKYNAFVRRCYGGKGRSSKASLGPGSTPRASSNGGSFVSRPATGGSASSAVPPQVGTSGLGGNSVTAQQMSCMQGCLPSSQMSSGMMACGQKGQGDPACLQLKAKLAQCSASCRSR